MNIGLKKNYRAEGVGASAPLIHAKYRRTMCDRRESFAFSCRPIIIQILINFTSNTHIPTTIWGHTRRISMCIVEGEIIGRSGLVECRV